VPATPHTEGQTQLTRDPDRGTHVVLSNSVAPSVAELYENHPAVAAAGLKTWRFPARRAVNSRPDRRGNIEELVVSNVTPQ